MSNKNPKCAGCSKLTRYKGISYGDNHIVKKYICDECKICKVAIIPTDGLIRCNGCGRLSADKMCICKRWSIQRTYIR